MKEVSVQSQRKTFLLLLVSAILLAFLVDLLAAMVLEQAYSLIENQLFIALVTIITATIVVVVPFILTEPRSTLVKEVSVPIVFKIKRGDIELIDVDDYLVSLSAHLAIRDIFKSKPTLKKRFADSLKSELSQEKKGKVTHNWNDFFLRNLAQYLIWNKIETAFGDYFNRLKEIRQVSTSEIPFRDYPEQLAKNLFISNFTSPEKKPKGDISNVVVASTEYGEWVNPDYLYLEVPKGVKLYAESLDNHSPCLRFKGNCGELRIQFGVWSLSIEGQKISLFAEKELDFHPESYEKNPSWEILITTSLKLSRFSSFRKGLEDFLNWAELVVSKLEEMDWSLFLNKIPHKRLKNIETKMDEARNEIEYLKKIVKDLQQGKK